MAFIKDNDALPTRKINAVTPIGNPRYIEADDINDLWDALDEVRTHTSGIANVKLYGAVGDGVTNDSAAIQAALDAVKAAGGGTVFFPRGTYHIGSATLKYQAATSASLTLRGAGKYAGVEITASGSAIILDMIGSDRLVCENVRIATSGTCAIGLLLARKVGSSASSGVRLQGVSIVGDFSKSAVYSINSEVNTLDGCEIRNTHALGGTPATDGAGTYAFYTSTENDQSVTSDGGTIQQSGDSATNSVINIRGGSIMHYGAYGVAVGVFGNTRVLNLDGVYLFSKWRGLYLNKSSVQTQMLGPINVQNCSFEGDAGAYGIYIGGADFELFRLNVERNLFSITGASNDYEIYQASVTTGGLQFARIRNNVHTASEPVSLSKLFYSDVGDCFVHLRGLAFTCEWTNCLGFRYDSGAQDQGGFRHGLTEFTARGRRLRVGPPPTTASSEYDNDSTLQAYPSARSITYDATDDVGVIRAWKGSTSGGPFGVRQDSGGHYRHYLTYWTGYEHLPLGSGRKETWSAAAPATGDWSVGDVAWNSAPAGGSYLGWVCVTAGSPGTWKGFGALEP